MSATTDIACPQCSKSGLRAFSTAMHNIVAGSHGLEIHLETTLDDEIEVSCPHCDWKLSDGPLELTDALSQVAQQRIDTERTHIMSNTTTRLLRSALNEEVLRTFATWADGVTGAGVWLRDDVPDGIEIARDIMRGYVVGRSKRSLDGADAWTDIGMEADMLLLAALEEIAYENDTLTTEGESS